MPAGCDAGTRIGAPRSCSRREAKRQIQRVRPEFQQNTKGAKALRELTKAIKQDQQALEKIAAGDTSAAVDLLIQAAEHKARAELFISGHNPRPGPFPDGTGGFDAGDPLFADGFESGDVSAWSTGNP